MDRQQAANAGQAMIDIINALEIRGGDAEAVVRLKQLVAAVTGELVSSKAKEEQAAVRPQRKRGKKEQPAGADGR